MPLEHPILSNPIAVDIPKLNEILDALSKANPTDVDGISTGAMRLYEVSSGKWQWQEYNGSTWAPVPFLQHSVDQLDGYHAAITPAANTVAVRGTDGKLKDDITGNAATASSAATLSQTLPVNKGGTGATTSEAARSNLGVPPTSHASSATTYGVGNSTQYGHLKLSDATDSASGATGGTAATPAAVKAVKETADAAQTAADNAMIKASTLATASTPGIVKPGTGMAVDATGALNANTASTSESGIVQLNNTVTSTSTTQAATADAVKTAYDKAVEAHSAVSQLEDEVSTKLENSTIHIIKTWKSSDGSSWYRKWSDGFIDQGGTIVTSSYDTDKTCTFATPFSKQKSIRVCCTCDSNFQDGGMWMSVFNPWGITTTSFNIRLKANLKTIYYACGY